MANDDPYSTQKPAKPPGTASKTTRGPCGGGNKYIQTAFGQGFITVPSIKGHSQKSNIKPK